MVLGRPTPKARQLARLPVASLSAVAIGLCALAMLFSPPTSSASTPLLEMNSTLVGRKMLSGARLGVRSVKAVAPASTVPHSRALSAAKKRW